MSADAFSANLFCPSRFINTKTAKNSGQFEVLKAPESGIFQFGSAAALVFFAERRYWKEIR